MTQDMVGDLKTLKGIDTGCHTIVQGLWLNVKRRMRNALLTVTVGFISLGEGGGNEGEKKWGDHRKQCIVSPTAYGSV